jgi:hypothetical protein
MKHIGRHVWKLKSKEIIKSPSTLAPERGISMRVEGAEPQRDRVLFIFECAICGTEKVEIIN